MLSFALDVASFQWVSLSSSLHLRYKSCLQQIHAQGAFDHVLARVSSLVSVPPVLNGIVPLCS